MKKCAHSLLLLLSLPAAAELPLSLEGIAPTPQRFKFGASLSYYNHRNSDWRSGESVYIHTPQNTLLEIPGRVEEGRHNSDLLYLSGNLNYGLSADTELYASIGGLWQHSRYSHENDASDSSSRHELSDITLGVNYVFLEDGDNPALIGVIEGSVLEKIRGENVYGKSWFIGVNSYKAIDPVVFSLNAGYRFNLSNASGRQPGDYWLIRPGVSFAANDRTTFSAHLRWTGKHPDRIDGEKRGAFASNTHAILGVGYALTNQTSINADVQWHLSGDDGMNATLAFQHRF